MIHQLHMMDIYIFLQIIYVLMHVEISTLTIQEHAKGVLHHAKHVRTMEQIVNHV